MSIHQLGKAITQELAAVFDRIDASQIETLIEAIENANRIILIGVGREGLATRAFTMRLMHMGLDAHWIWDDTTPSIGVDDLLIATSGCGEIGHIHYVVETARKRGATIALVTGDPHKKTAQLADRILFVPASVYLGTADVVPSAQPMGNLFEQALLITFDMLVMTLRDRKGITPEEMEKRHRNLE
ncbi:MAG: SIS domain-containing protein [Desulfobacterales bacterium]|nr:MAG: SIS domain-containing protein [Desulfobacterales bacterium]